MKITSLNLAGYKNWAAREPAIVNYLNKVQADVVFLQEVMFDPRISPLSEAQHINSKLETPYQYTQSTISRSYISSDGVESREGLAILSRHPITESEVLVLHKQDDDKHTRIVQNVHVLVHGQMQKFTNVHFSNNAYAREQLEELLRIHESRGEKRIIIGDFNIADLEAVRHLYEDSHTTSMVMGEYVSFPSEAARFDYILLPKEYTLVSLDVAEGLSDHNALTAEIYSRAAQPAPATNDNRQ